MQVSSIHTGKTSFDNLNLDKILTVCTGKFVESLVGIEFYTQHKEESLDGFLWKIWRCLPVHVHGTWFWYLL